MGDGGSPAYFKTPYLTAGRIHHILYYIDSTLHSNPILPAARNFSLAVVATTLSDWGSRPRQTRGELLSGVAPPRHPTAHTASPRPTFLFPIIEIWCSQIGKQFAKLDTEVHWLVIQGSFSISAFRSIFLFSFQAVDISF